jgi:hypothetical protein
VVLRDSTFIPKAYPISKFVSSRVLRLKITEDTSGMERHTINMFERVNSGKFALKPSILHSIDHDKILK